MTASFYELLADSTVAVHAAVVLFVVGGQVATLLGWARGWRWTRNFPFRAVHLTSIAYVVMEAWLGITCPLTTLENHFRRMAGVDPYGTSFIGYWLNRLLFYTAPDWVFILVYTAFALAVAITWAAYPPRRRRH